MAYCQYHTLSFSDYLTEMQVFSLPLPSVPEAVQEEDATAAEEEPDEQQGEGRLL